MNLDTLAQWGPLGIFAGVMIILIQRLLKREQDRSDKAETEVNRLNALFQEKVFPLLGTVANVLESATAVLKDIQRQREIDEILKQRERDRDNGTKS